MSEDREGKTYSFDVCSRCKLICCQDANPPLSPERKRILSNYVKEHKIPIQNLFAGEEYSHPAADLDGVCVFYDKGTHKCRVHQVKPETCRAGPITFDINFRTQKVEFYLKKTEICAFAQLLYQDKKNFSEHFKIAKSEIMRLICELDVDALLFVLKIPEPQTFKISESKLTKEVAEKLGIE